MLSIGRRDFITLLGSAAAWPIAARAQQRERMRRIGVLIGLAADDPEGQTRITAFVQGLQELGWADGRNVRMEFRSGASIGDRYRKYAEELVALSPDALLAGGNPSAQALQQATHTLPIVFANVGDPVGMGYVASMARPGGNSTGFMNSEFSIGAKWLELLREIAPGVTRVAVVRINLVLGSTQIGQFAAIRTAAAALGVELTPIDAHDASEIERPIAGFAHGSNDGLIVTGGGITKPERDRIIALAARHRLPAVYPFRRFVSDGGLISYANDQAEPYRLAAGYVDRILKGEKPADLPVQAPTKFEMVINLKTAKALGVTVPPGLLVTANEVIE